MAKKKQSKARQVMARINQQMQADVLTMASDPHFQMEKVPIGILALERITGGGFTRGRHVELYGEESTGKSSAAYMTLALAQERGEVCAVIDSEHVFDTVWFKHLGGDPDELLFFHPDTAEKVIKVLMLFCQTDDDNPGADIVLVDSVASMLPREELEKDVDEGDDRVASLARTMSRLLRRVTTVNDRTLFIWTNQARDKIGGYGGITTPGGRALKFYASTRLEFRRGEKIKSKRKVGRKGKLVEAPITTGHWVLVRSEKEKTARPHRESMFAFDSEANRVDEEMDIINLGLEDNLIERRGDVYVYMDIDGEEWRGTVSRFKGYLKKNRDLRDELVEAISERSKQLASPYEETDGNE